MTDPATDGETPPVTFTEDHVPLEGIEESIEELVDLYGGEIKESRQSARTFVLPLRRGVAAGGKVECTVSWEAVASEETSIVTLTCDRDVDAPKLPRILMLVAGVIGSVRFTVWPFFPQGREFGVLAWMGGAIALAVYFLSLRRTSGGMAFDFLQRLANRQRGAVAVEE